MKDNPPAAFVSASATGIYPVDTGEEFDEFSEIRDDGPMSFPQKLCHDWEATILEGKKVLPNCKISIIRVSLVVGPEQNGIKAMLLPFKWGLGGPIAGGQQYFPWIHEEDLAKQFYRAAMHPETSAEIINGVAPEAITQGQFASAFGGALYRPAFIPAPGFALRLILQERAELVITGAKILPRALKDFEYSFPDIKSALADVVDRLQ
jgi:uncharacterized protein